MIATISGIITSINEQCLVIEQSGIGYELNVPTAGTFNLQQQVTLQTYLHWNQESGPSLYGFQSTLEKITFLLIISCSGIGPKIGLTVLNQMDPAIFLQAILEENIKTLSSINGIGAKKAEQMTVALKHKVAKLLKDQPSLAESSKSLGAWKDLIDTLSSLSYSPVEIKSAMSFLKESNLDSSTPLSQLLRKALAFLAKK